MRSYIKHIPRLPEGKAETMRRIVEWKYRINKINAAGAETNFKALAYFRQHIPYK